MKKLIAATALAVLPFAAQAETSVTASGALNFGFLTADGLEHDSTTIEAAIDLENNGFRAGVWIGSLDSDPTDNVEIELSIGYGRALGQFSYDVGLIGYYLDDSGHQGTGLGLEFGYDVNDQISLALYSEVDLDSKDWISELSLSYALNDTWSFDALVGTDRSSRNTYGEIGVNYAINDTVGLSLVYEDANDGPGYLTFSVSFETGLFGG